MKIKRIIESIKAQDADGAWITRPINIYYLTGYYSNPHERLYALLIKPNGEQILFCPQLEVEDVKLSPFTGKIISYLDSENPLLKARESLSVLLVEAEHLTLQRQRELRQHFDTQQFGDIDETLKHLRNIKSSEEIEKLTKAANLADRCVAIGVDYLEEGRTEREVVNHIENEIKKYGINEMSFDTMVLFGDHAASPHGVPGDRKLQQDEYVLFDLGVVYNHYCSDITRTIAFGTPDNQAQRIYEIVKEAQTQSIKAIKPGIEISEIDKIARDIITQHGYGEYFTHRLGHGIGIEAHEYQDISGDNHNVLEEGMVITIEPGIYVKGVAGVRIEDDILVTNNGAQILTTYSK
ncbi:Xaa-Pro peptidase family protein [Staphylococcus sp. SQ8-PEA]|uniref:Xaa-Pro peptidase family protein n=1 Tax=Staphylococcus marylandisciuri TaxID=2981529 RepID=A0ABT2QQ66_9STAP|nr:Xaa-Pro peptidase family protein [Staphylococcus marylandisciuri]MCU5746108.1 Xaa-Pro peptidase family protein [Staphylococcus marylandisciuri]